jgi:hypothetical protein
MQGRVVHALIRREVDVYRAQGLHEEALALLENTLRSSPDLPGPVRAGFQSQISRLRDEVAGSSTDEQTLVSDEQLDVIRNGWAGSDTLEDHLECAVVLHALGRCAEALKEFVTAAVKGQPLDSIMPQMADCLARASAPQAVAQETERIAGSVLPDPTPERVSIFGLATAEIMAGAGHLEHAAALTRRLAVLGAVPPRCRERVQALAERTIGGTGRPQRPSLSERWRGWLRRPGARR